MSKTVAGVSDPADNARRRRGAAYLVAGPWAVNRVLVDFLEADFWSAAKLSFRAQKPLRAAEGLPP